MKISDKYDWIDYGAKGWCEIPGMGLQEVFICGKPQFKDGCWQVPVMPEDHSRWAVDCESLFQKRQKAP